MMRLWHDYRLDIDHVAVSVLSCHADLRPPSRLRDTKDALHNLAGCVAVTSTPHHADQSSWLKRHNKDAHLAQLGNMTHKLIQARAQNGRGVS